MADLHYSHYQQLQEDPSFRQIWGKKMNKRKKYNRITIFTVHSLCAKHHAKSVLTHKKFLAGTEDTVKKEVQVSGVYILAGEDRH